MTTTSTRATAAVERIHADHTVTKRLGNWTRAGHVQVRARRGLVVLDLRSPDLPDDIALCLELQRATVKLLVPDDAVVEHWDLRWTARGRIKDAQGPATEGSAIEGPAAGVPALAGARRIRLTGVATDSEVRVHRGGIAVLSAMCSRAYLQDLRLAHRTGGRPTVDDPARAHGH
ncbi:hypothetical protein AB0E10_18910 [Streptomyces sp. NPDC048045]|uniref:hypothetical protein n=1 Tax=Streptomyces sp. NPDC048045 TaxID=3154710 RepID=UPI0034290C60